MVPSLVCDELMYSGRATHVQFTVQGGQKRTRRPTGDAPERSCVASPSERPPAATPAKSEAVVAVASRSGRQRRRTEPKERFFTYATLPDTSTLCPQGLPWLGLLYRARLPDRDGDETRRRMDHRRHRNKCRVLGRGVGSILPLWHGVFGQNCRKRWRRCQPIAIEVCHVAGSLDPSSR
jgi:hypothetical protein